MDSQFHWLTSLTGHGHLIATLYLDRHFNLFFPEHGYEQAATPLRYYSLIIQQMEIDIP